MSWPFSSLCRFAPTRLRAISTSESSTPVAGSSPRKPGSVLVDRHVNRRAPGRLGVFPTRNPSAPDAGSSPRESGSLLVDLTRFTAELTPIESFFPTRNPSALDVGSSPCKPGSVRDDQ